LGSRKPDNVQGACFTQNYRLVLICDEGLVLYKNKTLGLADGIGVQFLQVYSTLTGHLLGEMPFPANSDRSNFVLNELESVRVAEITSDEVTSQLQVLELNNEWSSTDDIYLWGVTVPDPTSL
jgi:hypothetical protein